MNKKAIVFTFIVVSLLSIVLIAFLLNLATKNSQSKLQETNVKVETINSFVKTVNTQLIPQALKSSSNRVVLSWLHHLNKTNVGLKNRGSGKFIVSNTNLNTELKDALVDAHYREGVTLYYLDYMNETDNGLVINYTLPSILNEIRDVAGDSGINFQYDNPATYTYAITQISPWEIKVEISNVGYRLNDTRNEISWVFSGRSFATILNVTNYNEPMMLVFNEREVTINKTQITDFSNINNLVSFYSRPEYREHSDAPSFLNRLQGNFTPDVNGIETVLEPNPAYFPNPSGYSNVDFEYWGYVDGCEVDDPGSPGSYISNLYLTTPHLASYIRTHDSLPNCPVT